jgi:hypothetical protein
MRWRGDIQYASRVDSPLFVKNPLQGVLQGLLQAATGTGEDIEAALVLTADPVLAGKDDATSHQVPLAPRGARAIIGGYQWVGALRSRRAKPQKSSGNRRRSM